MKWPDGYNKGTPVLEQGKPEYEVDKTSQAYQDYLKAMLEYDVAVAGLKAAFDRQIGANVLEPGDVKKFELFITSDSKHTYKYKDGSFTLATPEWKVNEDGTVTGFDGQILPDQYVDLANYYVTVTAKPIQDLFKAVGMDDPTNPLNYWMLNDDRTKVILSCDGNGNITSYASYWDTEIKNALAEYPGETLAEQLNSYILAYYGNKYDSIDALVAGDPEAAAELTKTTTSGNKWFTLGGEKFVVDAHLETVKYDNFYMNLFSFAFGDKADIDNLLVNGKFNEVTNRWEYENNSWTKNEYQLALYYYMDHKEIWTQTDLYFQNLLAGGLSAEEATWKSLMMVLNIDGELTGNDWQNTAWPWYSSIALDRNDYRFQLTKTKINEDGTISKLTDAPAEFQLWYVKDGKKVYLKQDTDADGYPVFFESEEPVSITTGDNGTFEGLYSMMKDRVYYLKETAAPEGYEIDPTIYVISASGKYDEDELAELMNEANEAIEELKTKIKGLINDDYTANKEALEKIQEKVDALMAADEMSDMDVAVYADELKEQLAKLKVQLAEDDAAEMTIEELGNAISEKADSFHKAEETLTEKTNALEEKRAAAAEEIDRLNVELDTVKAEFADLKARYDASTDTNERNAMINEMKALQARAESLSANMTAVKDAYDRDAAHKDYEDALAAAKNAKAVYDAYAKVVENLGENPEYKELKKRLDALSELEEAKKALVGSENDAKLAALEAQLKMEKERTIKLINDLQKDPKTNWAALLDLDVSLLNKAIKDGTLEIPTLPELDGSVILGDGANTVLPDAGELDFDIPPYEPPEDPDDPPPPPPPPEEPDNPPPPPPPEEPPEDPEIPDEDIPLDELPELPDDEIEIDDPDVPLTGDNSGMWYAPAMLSAFGLAVLVITKKREDSKN